MKREILFRGKRVDNGEWIEGFVGHCWDYANGGFLWVITENKGDPLPTQRRVDPSTICQYTGLEDKNWVKIFEGDIVTTGYEFEGWVSYMRNGFVIENEGCFCSDFTLDDWRNFEITGNIHDKETK